MARPWHKALIFRTSDPPSGNTNLHHANIAFSFRVLGYLSVLIVLTVSENCSRIIFCCLVHCQYHDLPPNNFVIQLNRFAIVSIEKAYLQYSVFLFLSH